MSWIGRSGRALSFPPVRDLIDAWDRRADWPANRLAVLTYHRVDRPGTDPRYPGLISATPEEFADQITVLSERAHVVAVGDVLDAMRGANRLPDRAVLLTFDDAVDDFERHALPVLRAFGLPALVFVPTDFVDRPEAFFWWDAVHAAVTTSATARVVDTPVGRLPLGDERDRRSAYRRLRDHCLSIDAAAATEYAWELCRSLGVEPPPAHVMSSEQLRALGTYGVSCAPHTCSHAHLDHIGIDAVRAEIEGSLSALRGWLGDVPPAFAYPAGRLTEPVQRVTRDAGIEIAFTTARGSNDVTTQDPMAFRRINVSRTSGFGTVRAQMIPFVERFVR